MEPPAQRHSETSVAAAESIKPCVETQRARIYRFLVRRGTDGATDEEVQLALSMSGNTVRPRRIELQKLKYVRDSGRARKTIANRSAVVWVVALRDDGTPREY